ncbi:MAG: TlpA disulfide reductase family protein [Chloroflexota bacterium]
MTENTTIQEPEFLQNGKPKTDDTSTTFFTPANIFLMTAVIVFVSVMGIQLFNQNQGRPLPGDRAPSFAVTTYDGEEITLDSLEGQIVVLNLWASWCGPCHEEADDFQAIYEDYQSDGVVVLGVNWLDIDSDALEFVDQYSLTYPNAPDFGERVYEAYNVQGMPETFVIGRNGIVVETLIGGTNYDQLSRAIDTALAGES